MALFAIEARADTENKMKKSKIVALIPVKNESNQIEFCLRAVSLFCDAICLYDDHCDDDTIATAKKLEVECNIECIVKNSNPSWHFNETRMRQELLNAGREVGGTHFITIDADEAITSNLAVQDKLRNVILSLNPGDTLEMVWIQLWRNHRFYRFDDSIWTNNYKTFVFADDEKCFFHNQNLHLLRSPSNLKGKTFRLEGYDSGIMHFQFINWRNLLVKQAWYRCLEHIQNPKKPVAKINQRYAPSKDETGLAVRPSPSKWFDGYPFFDPSIYDWPETWRETAVIEWFETFGPSYFMDLDIWDIDWGGGDQYRKRAFAPCAQSRCDVIGAPCREDSTLKSHPPTLNELSADYLVSAIVSTYNSERFLNGCIEDLNAQTLSDKLEIIIVNSGSEQNEEAIVDKWQRRCKNIVYIRSTERESVYQAWNRAIRIAKGKYITNANTDDRHAPYALEYMAGILWSRPEIALVYADVWITEKENETFDRFTPSGKYQWKDFDPVSLSRQCYIGPQPMWRRALHETYGWFDEAFKSAGDWEFWLRVAKRETFLHIPKCLGLYLKSATSIEHRDPDLTYRETITIRQRYAT